jgi:hypothetical protein
MNEIRNIPVIIPQLFYDLIARILPGFFFLFIFRFIFSNTFLWGDFLNAFPCSNSVEIFFYGISYLVVCYFIGWMLRIIPLNRFLRILETMDEKRSTLVKEAESKKELTINDKYQMIKIFREEAGFRILKLRAEARMLEVTRNGLIIILLFTIPLAFLAIIPSKMYDWILIAIWSVKIIGLFIFVLIFDLGFHISFKNYIGNIEKIFEILSRFGRIPTQNNE